MTLRCRTRALDRCRYPYATCVAIIAAVVAKDRSIVAIHYSGLQKYAYRDGNVADRVFKIDKSY